MAKDLKRSLTIAGHRTSLSLEPEFWQALQDVARTEKKTLASLVGEVDRTRGNRNLSSAIRVWLFRRANKA
jgi:predicted DNA-binding ribbon-helix-helix protein